MSIFFVFLAPLHGGAFVQVCALNFDLVSASTKDHSNRLLTRGVVGGDVEQVMGGSGFQAAKLVD